VNNTAPARLASPLTIVAALLVAAAIGVAFALAPELIVGWFVATIVNIVEWFATVITTLAATLEN
jgi:hypothetical protein